MKRPLRKTLSMVLCLILVLSTLVPVFADTAMNSDYDTHWAKAAITSAVASGITKGYPDGSFKPENLITRAEFFALVNNAFKLTQTAPASYTDVAADAWYAPVVAKAKAAGYISGYADGSIHPESNITRQEAAVILSRAKALKAQSGTLTFSDATAVAAWGKEAVEAVSEAKIMKGYPDGSFKPEAQIKRAEALVAITACTDYVAPAAQVSSKDKVYDKAGSFGSSTETVTVEGDVVIKAPGVTLQNTIIKGNLTIAKEVGKGDVTLKSVVVKGNTYVKGGGENSVYFVNVTTGKVYVQKDDGPVRIVASGTSEIDELLAGSDVKLEEVNMTGAGFEGITVEKNAAGGVDITLAGVKCDSIDIKAPGVTLNADKASTISKLTVDAANTQLKGTGKIENAVINAGGVNFETKPTKTETAPGVTAPTVTPAPTAPTGGGGGGGGGSGTPALSGDAGLKSTCTVKGRPVISLGTPGTTIGTAMAGSVRMTSLHGANTSNLAGFVTLFEKSSSAATVKAVRYSNGASTDNFSTASEYANEALQNQDFFIIRVTAANGSIQYYKIIVTFDNTAPSAALTYTVGGSPVTTAKDGTIVLITATFSEVMSDTPVVKLERSVTDTYAAVPMTMVDNQHYTYLWTVGSGAAGANGIMSPYLSVGKDLAGVVVDGTPTSGANTVLVDNTPPVNNNSVLQANVTKRGGAAVAILSSGTAANQIWLAPLGTMVFSEGATMTKAPSGISTGIAAPATAGTYYLFIIDEAGNLSAASTTTLTVNNSFPSNQNTVLASSTVKKGGIHISITSSGDVTNDVWLAPAGTNTFIEGNTMTKAANGTSTAILTPTNEGAYQLYVINAAGNASDPSTATVTVDNTAPTNQDTVLASSVVKKGGSTLTIASSGVATNAVWLMIEGFSGGMVEGPTLSKASSGIATTIIVPSTEGNYKLLIADEAGNFSSLSTATVTVDNTKPTNQDAVLNASVTRTIGGSMAVAITSSGDAANSIWLAPEGTTNFTAGATMTKADNGTATTINAPGAAGTYRLYVVDAAGNISDPSTVIVTVLPDTTAPTVTGWSFESNHNNIIENDEKLVITFSEPMENDLIYGNDLFYYLEQIPFTLYAGGRSGQWSDDRTFFIMLNSGSSAPVGSGLKFLHRNIYPFTDRAGNAVDVVNGSPTYTIRSGDF